jgi:hypothetical protein
MAKYYLQYTMDNDYEGEHECCEELDCTHDELQEHIKWLRAHDAYNIDATEMD